MYFFLLLFNFFFFLLNKLQFKIAQGSLSIYFTFIMMNLIAFIALCFSLFLPKLIDLLGKQRRNNGL